MNSHLLSLFLWSLAAVVFSWPLLAEQEISLEADKASIAKLRENRPQEIKKENDDLGIVLRLFDKKSLRPSSIQSRFNDLTSKRRRDSRRYFKDKRSVFNAAAKKKRNTFFKEQKSKRDKLFESKPDSKKRLEFMGEQKVESKSFFAKQSDDSKSFNADMNSERKIKRNELRDMRREFTDRMRIHKKEYRKQKKIQRAIINKRPIKDSDLLPEYREMIKDFDKVPKQKGQQVGPE